MRESVKRMDEIINQLVRWVNDYPDQILTSLQKQRVIHILTRLSNSESISLDLIEQAISKDAKRLELLEKFSHIPVPNLPEFKGRFNYFVCIGCDTRILKGEFDSHKKECREYKDLMKQKKMILNQAGNSKGTSITSDLPGKTYEESNNELKNEGLSNRQQDGSRDFYQFRESGKYGSMSSFDDHGDESNP